MKAIRIGLIGVLTTVLSAGSATAHHPHPGPRCFPLAAVGGGYNSYGPPFFMTIGPNGPMVIMPPTTVVAPVIMMDRGIIGGPVPQRAWRPVARVAPARALRPDPARAVQLVTIGDRLFRAGNTKRAEERYQQAGRADPEAAAPRVRLAQVALVRGRFDEAASRFREAVAVEPGWLARAPNIESVYSEPADFHRLISRLESRVLVEPNDRDAWLVLGAQLFLSGQTRRAADVFLRLSDRKPDPTLAAFLDAAGAPGPPEE